MVGGQHVGVLDGAGVGLEGVGRRVDLALADQLPGEPLWRAVEQTVFVDGHGAVGADHRLIETVARQLPYAPGRWAVGPGLARIGAEVVGFMGNTDGAVVPGRLEGHVVAHGRNLVFGPGVGAR
ncbi:hypothetical protein D3C73_1175960 [compost metagenome]